ncbi:MAG: hypothetical protein QOF01_790 [Thermomicrobiales bacterium]|nr:hypothetical protein [Thermomicrobiales bacterium]
MIRLHRLLVVGLVVALLAPIPGAAQQSTLPPELAALADSGVTVDLLASDIFPPSVDASALRLERLTPGPVAEQTTNTLGPELWYVEAGTLILAKEGGESKTYQSGERTLIPDVSSVSYRSEGSDCPSVIRLALRTVFAMEVSSDLAGPDVGAEVAKCPAAGTLFKIGTDLAVPAGPTFAFVARMTFPSENFPTNRTFSGPVGYSPESGSLGINVSSAASTLLVPGSWVVVNGNEPHGVSGSGGEPATALVAGLVATGESVAPTVTVPPPPTVTTGVQGSTYRSPTYGYSVSWDDTWTVAAETSADGSDLLQLNNGVSDVYFQSYGNYTGDPAACVASIAEQFPTRPGWSNVEPMRTAGGDPIAGGETTRAYAVYTFSYTVDAATTDYVEYLECRALVPGQSVLVVTQIAPRDAYPEQVESMRALLDGLVVL